MFVFIWLTFSLPHFRPSPLYAQLCFSQNELVGEWTQGCQEERARLYGD